MIRKTYHTPYGDVVYWISESFDSENFSLIFLPGLTADHRLFDKQLDYFDGKYNLLVWDAPGHAASRPFELTFTLADKAKWLHEIMAVENIKKPVIVGQSMGGYVGQAYCELFPKELFGLVSIDSAPLQREYVTGAEIWLLKRMEPVYRYFPWKWLLSLGSSGVAQTEYGRKLMLEMMLTYDGNKENYVQLASHGYKILAEAMEADLPYRIDCPALLICGKKDHAGSCIRYNRQWHKQTDLPLVWIENAGHNSNTDAPDTVNKLIEDFVKNLQQ